MRRRLEDLFRALAPWLCFLAAFFLADILFFRVIFWQLPDESAWSDQPHYHFLYKLHHLQPGRPESPLVLIVGSSIALNSILPERLERDWKGSLEQRRFLSGAARSRSQLQLRVRMLAHQGMTPLHLMALRARIERLRPSLVVYPVNPVDLRIERPLVHRSLERLVSGSGQERQEARLQFIRLIAKGDEFLALAPVRTLLLYGKALNMEERSRLFWGGVSAAWRYHPIAPQALGRLWANHFTRGRHYHAYAGIPIRGISHKGWVADRFSFVVTPKLKRDGLYFQAPKRLLDGKGRVALRYRLCDAERPASCRAFREYLLRPGWQRLMLPRLASRQEFRFEGRVGATFQDPLVADRRSLRFPRNFGREEPLSRKREGRQIRREDLLYSSYTDREYQESYQQRILNFNRAGAAYLKALHDAKRAWARLPFDPEALPSLQALEGFRRSLGRHSIPFLFYSSPENPLSLRLYQNSPWHKGFDRFVESGSVAPLRRAVLQKHFRMQDFSDYHHMTYFGAGKMTRLLLERLQKVALFEER